MYPHFLDLWVLYLSIIKLIPNAKLLQWMVQCLISFALPVGYHSKIQKSLTNIILLELKTYGVLSNMPQVIKKMQCGYSLAGQLWSFKPVSLSNLSPFPTTFQFGSKDKWKRMHTYDSFISILHKLRHYILQVFQGYRQFSLEHKGIDVFCYASGRFLKSKLVLSAPSKLRHLLGFPYSLRTQVSHFLVCRSANEYAYETRDVSERFILLLCAWTLIYCPGGGLGYPFSWALLKFIPNTLDDTLGVPVLHCL